MNTTDIAERKDITPATPIDEKLLVSYLDTFVGGAKALPENVKIQFLQLAKAFNLNPFKREVYLVKYSGMNGDEFSIIVGYEAFLQRGERSGSLDGWGVTTTGELKKNKETVTRKKKDGTGTYTKEVETWEGDLEAHITIYRKDRTHPFHWTVPFSEYNAKNSMWLDKPLTQIKKVVIAQGFRLCFPVEMEGMGYIAEEIERKEIVDTHAEEVTITEEMREALDLLNTALFNDPKSHETTRQTILKGENVLKVIEYLKTRQPEPESEEKKEAQQLLDNLSREGKVDATLCGTMQATINRGVKAEIVKAIKYLKSFNEKA